MIKKTKNSRNWNKPCSVFTVESHLRSSNVLKGLKRHIIYYMVTIFVLTGCGAESGNRGLTKKNTINEPPTINIHADSEISNPSSTSLNTTAGTGSGGGGYDDGAKLLIQASQKFLASFILNASSVHFQEFPEGWDQERIIQIINDLEFSGDYRTRDDEDLLFDFNEENSRLFYTKKFVDKFGQNKFTVGLNGNLQELKEVSLHILHELSHLLGVGKSKETNNRSSVFAVTFMDNLLTETTVCTDKVEENDEGSFIFALNPPTGMMHIRAGDEPLDQSHLVIKVTDGFKGFEWSLGSPFGFFDLFSHSSLADTAYLTAVSNPEEFSGHSDHSPLDLIFSLSYDKEFEESSVFFMKKRSDQPYISEEKVVTYENGEFIGNLLKVQEFSLSDTKLTYKNSIKDPAPYEENIDMNLSCQSYVSPIRFKEISNLDFSEKPFSEVANPFLFETSVLRLMEYANCNEEPHKDGQTKDTEFKDMLCNGLRSKVEEIE